MNRPFLKKAIDLIGGQVATADAVEVKQAHVWAWLNKTIDGIPEKKVIPVAKATGWKVTPHQLRPDIYPHPDDGLPDHLRIPALEES
ncbi:MAG: YdaS family helix-turn-helix protein [Methylophilaceae bacterium]|nr:YdaS family helix-turn-helix protein [Methyloradius sp.]